MPLSFTLDDRSTVKIGDADIEELYDQLWLLAPKPGAISVAARLRSAQRGARASDPLNARETGALLAALDRLQKPH